MNVPLNFNPAEGSGVVINENLFSGNILLGYIQLQATLDEGRYHVEFSIQNPASINNLWRLQTFSTDTSSTFDCWASSSLIGTSDALTMLIPFAGDTINLQFPNYMLPDYAKSIVSSWQCSDKVITVGNYSNRAGYIDYDSNYIDLTSPQYGSEVVGGLFSTSSHGPTRDNRLKPDISATGSTTICTGDANDIAITLTVVANRFKVAYGGKDIREGGTSLASPIVAGIAALYLQKRPTATWNEIKNVLIWTATRDSFTGPNANNLYGYGKVNAFDALTYGGIVYGAMDTACTLKITITSPMLTQAVALPRFMAAPIKHRAFKL